jgi:hypothetical protein
VALPFVAADDGVAADERAECFNPTAVVMRAKALPSRHVQNSTNTMTYFVALPRKQWTLLVGGIRFEYRLLRICHS